MSFGLEIESVASCESLFTLFRGASRHGLTLASNFFSNTASSNGDMLSRYCVIAAGDFVCNGLLWGAHTGLGENARLRLTICQLIVSIRP